VSLLVPGNAEFSLPEWLEAYNKVHDDFAVSQSI
jgi:hypothetical protein